MANQEHVALVLKGEAWNRWRKENMGVIPDLSGADLRKAALIRAVLHNADLSGAVLSGTDPM